MSKKTELETFDGLNGGYLIKKETVTMHDSRGAKLEIGDRVIIEAEVISLNTGGDENYCCCGVRVVTPQQVDRHKVMEPPEFSALSTKMLTKVGK